MALVVLGIEIRLFRIARGMMGLGVREKMG